MALFLDSRTPAHSSGSSGSGGTGFRCLEKDSNETTPKDVCLSVFPPFFFLRRSAQTIWPLKGLLYFEVKNSLSSRQLSWTRFAHEVCRRSGELIGIANCLDPTQPSPRSTLYTSRARIVCDLDECLTECIIDLHRRVPH